MRLNHLRIVCAWVVLAAPAARAQTGEPSRPDSPEDRAEALERTLRAVVAQQAELKRELEALRARPAPAPAGFLPPVRVFGNVTLRYDHSRSSDPTDTLVDDITANGLRARVRFGAEIGAPDSLLAAGVRFSTGESPNPTVPFVPLSDALRPSAFGLDQAWFQVRPLADRDRLKLTFGRMPNPFWRGSVGTFRSELVWDDDVNPAGVALSAVIWKRGSGDAAVQLDNVAAWFQLSELSDLRFVGRTGVTGGFADQLRVASKFFTAAVAYYDWENLNAGLSAPGIASGGVSVQAAEPAFLLRPGLSQSNNHVNYGPGAAVGFLHDAFRVLNATAQLRIPIRAPRAGNPELYLLGDYAHNFVSRDGDGGGGTVGVRLGDHDAAINPLNLWVTYRYVQPDATLAAFADSDLGAGTGYRGLEAGANYRLQRNLAIQVSYFDFFGYPRAENHVQRAFLDLMGEF